MPGLLTTSDMQLRSMKKWCFSFLFLFSLCSPSIAGDTITLSTSIRDGNRSFTTLISAGGNFELGFFSPGNSKNRYLGIWYKKIPVQTVVWVANRRNPLTDYTGVLRIGNNGNLILQNRLGSVIWSTDSSIPGSPVAQLLDSGNLVFMDDSGSFVWQSFDYPSDTLLPGMKLGWNLRTNMNRYLTSWKSDDDPSPGDYSFKLDPQGLPQIFIWAGSVRTYRHAPWNGLQLSDIPELGSNDFFSFNFISHQDEVYYNYELKNSSTISRLVLSQSMVQRFGWLERTQEWKLYWSFPKDQCDSYAECGPYGVCNSNDSPICRCLQGFNPKSQQDWILRDGCVQKTRFECRQGDGFRKVTGMKLPDASSSIVDSSMSLVECREKCLQDCSCVAYANANISVGESGCVVWGSDLIDLRDLVEGGQDLYIREAASELGNVDMDSIRGKSNGNKKVIVIIIITVASGMLLLGTGGCFIWNKKLKNYGPAKDNCSDDENSEEDYLDLPLFNFQTIAATTDNFSTDKKLGQGGFGPVYKGKLGNGQDIAVKRLSKHSLQGPNEFKSEVKLITKLQHRNLVRLLGCCIQGEERMLIYEYMHNRSLDTFIFDKMKSMFLSWQKRFDIVEGIARGLVYLHRDSMFRIIHRDLKASNVLLDREMNPKISDFGAARIFIGDQVDAYTNRLFGTRGYMSPEYVKDGIFSVKSDVFSFGVLVLEILSGKKNSGFHYSDQQLNLLSYAWKLWNEGNICELLDDSVGSPCPISEAMRFIHVGLLCVQERAEDRPLMSSVVSMLDSATAVFPKPKQPGFCALRSRTDAGLFSNCTVNNVTVTMLEGR